jgi:hypothetical protein
MAANMNELTAIGQKNEIRPAGGKFQFQKRIKAHK